VGDHERRLAVELDGLAQEREDLGARRGVQVARGLVGEEDRRPGDERAGDRDALLLAARQLGRAVAAALGQPDAARRRVEGRAVGLAAGDGQRQEDVLLGRERRQQVEGLEDEADVLAAQLRELLVVELVMSSPPIETVPEVGVSRPASMCISVDLPEPDGPMTAVNWALGTSSVTPRRASTADSPSP
jgi:hypothetical protein